jgi:hypothetical protein
MALPSYASRSTTLGAMQFAVRDFSLMITRRELLEKSIAQLQTLANFLSDQLRETADRSAASETRACKEMLRAVSTLIQTYQSACAD